MTTPFDQALERRLAMTDEELLNETADRLASIPEHRLIEIVNSYMENG